MSKPVATVLIPTFNHGPLIGPALASALGQNVPVEVFIVCDGVAVADRVQIAALIAGDPRVRVFDHPKCASRGERYRHAALAEAQGEIVCYLCDRDLWLPWHVEQLLGLLRGGADFTHSLPLHILGDQVRFFPVDLTWPFYRSKMLHTANRVPLSCAAHTLAFYRQMASGWDLTPSGWPTDWFMFRKFLGHAHCRCASGTLPTALTFPSPTRRDWPRDGRMAELRLWQARLSDPAQCLALQTDLLQTAVRLRDHNLASLSEELAALQASAA